MAKASQKSSLKKNSAAKKNAPPAKKGASGHSKASKKAAKSPAKKARPVKSASVPAQKKSKSPAPRATSPKAAAPRAKLSKAKVVSSALKNPAKKLANDLSKFVSPLDDRILARLEVGERVTAGGLILPDTAVITGNRQAAVVAIGRGHMDKKGRVRPIELKIGDRILVSEYAGSKVKWDDEELVILRESEVLGVLDT